MTLIEYVLKHSERGSCRCGSCYDAPPESIQPSGHTVSVVFFEVAKVGDPSAEHLVEMIKAHRGYFNACDPLDGKEHSYIELGGWIGDQGLAFQLMGLGALLGLWKLLTPYTLLGDNADPNHVQAMAGAGFIVIQRMT